MNGCSLLFWTCQSLSVILKLIFKRSLGSLTECKRWVEVVGVLIEVPGMLVEVIEKSMLENVRLWTTESPEEVVKILINVLEEFVDVMDR
jgi:hypothetical protein